ncbi:MAG: thiamine phosphate synthase, partial [Chloroflexi bacterium]|nr:thiamine phosphate synthase [Chloroflexota bacterium]
MASPFGSNSGRLPRPCLCLVTDRRVCPSDELPGRVAAAVDGGVDIIQLRDKEMPGAALLELAERLRRVVAGRALLLINERADVAMAAEVDGVQLGEAALPTSAVRAIMGDAATIGRSVHSVSGACEAAESGADFLVVGTMFASNSHPGEEPSGPGLLSRIASAGVDIPMLGIGGINEHNAGEVISAGAHG